MKRKKTLSQYHEPIMEEYRNNLIEEKKQEIERLRKKISYLEKELEGMQINDR